MTFGERLKTLREQAGMSQAGVWEAAGLPRKTFLNYEQGVVSERIPFTAVLAISKAIGVDCSAFADCEMTPTEDEVPAADTAKEKVMGKRK